MQVWFPGGDDATLASVSRAFRDAFPYVRTFGSIEGWGIHFLGRMEPFPEWDGASLARRIPPRAAADLVEWNRGTTAPEMMINVLSREKRGERFDCPGCIRAADRRRPANKRILSAADVMVGHKLSSRDVRLVRFGTLKNNADFGG